MRRSPLLLLLPLTLLAGCSFAPHYVKPSVESPPAFKELTTNQFSQTAGWKTAEPSDQLLRGKWWEAFNDTNLNVLEDQAGASNNTVAVAFANFLAARAVMDRKSVV